MTLKPRRTAAVVVRIAVTSRSHTSLAGMSRALGWSDPHAENCRNHGFCPLALAPFSGGG